MFGLLGDVRICLKTKTRQNELPESKKREQSTCIYNMANIHLTVTNTPPYAKT